MPITIAYKELRLIKDSLPDGSMHKIAEKLHINVETVRNFFGGQNFKEGMCIGIHYQPGPDEGYVVIDDDTILQEAWKILELKNSSEL